ncbi:Dipeptidyl peptidase family member 1 [Caenorhabditis elegans]|uniref:Isoform a of Dipeptidyl peptidase family member 1 n=2 Tax=Caenorhabditis elegans TaxID=6239 RepID=Q7JKY3-2|nr:Dipeptidyl peptidase family member 1 [Caenorhabditis elegans]CAB03411.1 Dipeptidyl peptidase family member 1 [Caenorhabditis elegans]|eukprot:NP_506851.1 Dipeptidyl peptidase family member 1 [Caenorhabditis elegans]
MTAEADLLEGYDEELGGNESQKRDCKGITTAIVVVLLILVMIFAALVFFTPLFAAKSFGSWRLNVSDLRSLRYPYAEFAFTDNNAVVMQSWEGVEIVEDGVSRLIFGRENGAEITPSADRKYFAMMDHAPNPGMNPQNETFHLKIVNNNERITYDIGLRKEESVIQAFKWNGKFNDFVFVESNKIYYQSSPEEEGLTRVSNGGEHTVDGLFDWIYEEEIFGRKDAMWWSTKGDQLAYASYDNHLTKNVSLKTYHRLEPYPIDTNFHYPKTFAKVLPTYTLSIWNKKTEQSRQLDVQLKDSLSYHYLLAVKWLEINGTEQLVSVWTNRYQNEVALTICDWDTAICRLEFEYKYASKRWVTHDDFHSITSFEDTLFFLLPHDKRDNAFQQVASLRLSHGQLRTPKFLNLGEYDVTSINGINKETRTIFFHAAAPKPSHRSLFSYSLADESRNSAYCISCSIKNCTWAQAQMDDQMKTAIVSCKGPAAPHTAIVNLTRMDSDKKTEHANLLYDKTYQNRVEEAGLPVIIKETIKISDDFDALIKLSIPKDIYNRDKHQAIPLIVHVYGGPNDQNTKEATQIGIEEVVASASQAAILRIDGRGSGGRGWKYRSAIYGQLGTVEVEDQIKAIKVVLRLYRHLLDARRVAVFGWSYGGFMTLSMVNEAPEQFFKCAVSVAPVTNFAYYDATYTERYMGDAPLESYSDVTKKLDNFKSTRLLLMHGLLDDNVHFQNSAILIDELQNRGVDFDLMVYPNQAHSLSSRTSHVVGKMTHFLRQCFYTDK